MVVGMTLAFLGTGEIAVIVLLVLLLFGAERIPDLARALGRAQARFAAARDEVVETLEIERAGLTREQVTFERAREHQMRQALASTEDAQDASPRGGSQADDAPAGDKPTR